MIENSFCVSAIISILLVLVVCLFIGIPYKDTVAVIILTSVLVFLFKMFPLYVRNNKLNQQVLINNSLKKNVINNNTLNTFVNNKNTAINNKNTAINNKNTAINNNTKEENKPYHLRNSSDNIINAEMYNLDDCTTDKTCIQKPDRINLFTVSGIDKEDKYVSRKFESQNNGIDIEEGSKKKDNIVVEKFTNNLCPIKLNDVIKPFNNAIINPYKNYRNEEEIILEEDKYLSSLNVGDDLCFNCKIGHCQGGVCRDINEIKSQELNNVVKEINDMKVKRPHPFSNNFPTIRATNPESRF